jgi:hypothetical protein
VIPPTTRRTAGDGGHAPPQGGLDHTGARWRGASRVIDRPARRRANRRSWKQIQAEARATALAAKPTVIQPRELDR